MKFWSNCIKFSYQSLRSMCSFDTKGHFLRNTVDQWSEIIRLERRCNVSQ